MPQTLSNTEAIEWMYDIEPGGATQAVICESDGTVVAYIHALGGSTGHKALERNVRLMAAAPALLEALQSVLAMPDYDGTQETSARRLAIKRAARAALKQAINQE